MPSSHPWSCMLGCLRSRCVVPELSRCESTHVQSVTVPTAHCGPALHADTAPVEEYPWSRKRSLKLRASPSLDPPPSPTFTHSGVQTNPPVPVSKTKLSLAVARSARWCLADSRGNGTCAMPAVSEKSTGHRRTLGSVCRHALRARNASWVSSGRLQTSGLSKQVDRSR